MPELLLPRPKLSDAIREFASKAALPKSVTRKAAAVFFKTEEFERRLDSLRAERDELASIHEDEMDLLAKITPPTLEKIKSEHARREERIKATHGLLSQMEESYNGAHRGMDDLVLDEVLTQDRFVETKGELMLAAPPEMRSDAMGEVRKDDEAIRADYAKKFDALLDGWRKSFKELDGKYAELRSQYPPEKPIEIIEVPPEIPKPLPSEEAPKPIEVPKPIEAPKPAEVPAQGPAAGAEAQKPGIRPDVEKAARRIMSAYSLPESDFGMLRSLFERLAGDRDAGGEFLRVEALYETVKLLLSTAKLDTAENVRAVAANLSRRWEAEDGEWRAKSLESANLLSEATAEDGPALLALLKDPGVSPSSIIYWFELHYGEMAPGELDAAIVEDKARHPGAVKMIDSFHSLMSGFNTKRDRIVAALADLPRDREVMLVFEAEKVENELGGHDYYLLPVPVYALEEAKFDDEEFEKLLLSQGMHGYGHSHTSRAREEFTAKDLEALIRNPSLPHLLLNAETKHAQFYNPRIGRIMRLDTVEL